VGGREGSYRLLFQLSGRGVKRPWELWGKGGRMGWIDLPKFQYMDTLSSFSLYCFSASVNNALVKG